MKTEIKIKLKLPWKLEVEISEMNLKSTIIRKFIKYELFLNLPWKSVVTRIP